MVHWLTVIATNRGIDHLQGWRAPSKRHSQPDYLGEAHGLGQRVVAEEEAACRARVDDGDESGDGLWDEILLIRWVLASRRQAPPAGRGDCPRFASYGNLKF